MEINGMALLKVLHKEIQEAKSAGEIERIMNIVRWVEKEMDNYEAGMVSQYKDTGVGI